MFTFGEDGKTFVRSPLCGEPHHTADGAAVEPHGEDGGCWCSPVRAFIARDYGDDAEEKYAYVLPGVETEDEAHRDGIDERTLHNIVRGLAARGLTPKVGSEAAAVASALAEDEEATWAERAGDVLPRWNILTRFYDATLRALYLAERARELGGDGMAAPAYHAGALAAAAARAGMELRDVARLIGQRDAVSVHVARVVAAARAAAAAPKLLTDPDLPDGIEDFVRLYVGPFDAASKAFSAASVACGGLP